MGNHFYLAPPTQPFGGYVWLNLVILFDAALLFLCVNFGWFFHSKETDFIHTILFLCFATLTLLLLTAKLLSFAFSKKRQPTFFDLSDENICIRGEKGNIVFNKVIRIELVYSVKKLVSSCQEFWSGYCIIAAGESTQKMRIIDIDYETLKTLKNSSVKIVEKHSSLDIPPGIYAGRFFDGAYMLFQ